MGFFSNLFRNNQASNYRVTNSRPNNNTSTRPIAAPTYIPSFDVFDFEDEHEKDIERWNDKIDKAEPDRGGNPDKIVQGYEKAISLCEAFKDFCYSFGSAGANYYEEHEANRMDELESLLDEYLATEYEEDKRNYEAKKEADKLFSSIKHKITKYLSDNNGVMRKNIYAQFPEEQQPIVLKALNTLIADGKVIKEKQGGKLIFRINQ